MEMNFDEMMTELSNKEEYLVYEQLGDYYLALNIDKAYLCYENAAFLCEDDNKRAFLNEKKDKLFSTGKVTVRKTAFIILSHNNLYLTQKCLETIRQYCAPGSYSIVVVENASTDGSVEWLSQQPDIMLILCEENVGFPAGCNIGIQYADPEEDIFLLNNDTRMTHNALFWLRMGLYEDSHIGATGCVANYCGVDQLEDVIFELPNDYLEYAKKVNIPCKNPYEEKNKLGGFAMLVKRQVLNEVGLLDETFSPGYFEDDDFSMRIHVAGYRLLVCHNSFIYHAGSQSFIKRNDLEIIYERNHAYMVQKWGYDNQIFAAMHEEENDIINGIVRDKEECFRLLEVGAGSGNALSRVRYLYPNAEVFGVEANSLVVRDAVETVPILWLDWKKDRLPFVEKSFDYIIYTNREDEGVSLEAVTGYFERYLKSDGKLFITFK